MIFLENLYLFAEFGTTPDYALEKQEQANGYSQFAIHEYFRSKDHEQTELTRVFILKEPILRYQLAYAVGRQIEENGKTFVCDKRFSLLTVF